MKSNMFSSYCFICSCVHFLCAVYAGKGVIRLFYKITLLDLDLKKMISTWKHKQKQEILLSIRIGTFHIYVSFMKLKTYPKK